jgi:hypothetical protein
VDKEFQILKTVQMTVEEIIAALGGLTEAGTACGCRPSAVSYWVANNFVPEWRRDKLIALAKKKGVALTASDFPDKKNLPQTDAA